MSENIINLFDKYKLPFALSLLGLILIIGGVFASGLTKQKSKEYPKESLIQAKKVITVDVSGAVNKSGVYQLQDGARIEDAIVAAGGFSNLANQEYISKYLNLAQKLSDGGKVYVPSEGEQAQAVSGGVIAGVAAQGSNININTASESELDSLSGVGPVTASKIISGRPYETVEELLNKKIVSKAVFEKIKDQIVVY